MSVDDFVSLLRDEIGLEIAPQDISASLDSVPGWDSVHLLTLLTALERRTGQRVSLPAVLQAGSLAEVLELAVA